MKTTFKFHYAWVIAVASMLLCGSGSGIFVSTLGIFIKPICEQYDFSRASFSLYSSIYFIVNVSMMPIYGNMIDKYSYRKMGIVASAALSVCLIGYSFAHSLPMFYLCAFFSGLFINGINLMGVGVLINRWFIDSRGLAAGLAFSGSGLLASFTQPVCTYFISAYGTAWTYRFLAVLVLILTLPILLFLIKDHPEEIGLTPYINGNSNNQSSSKKVLSSDVGFTREEAMKMPAFWLLFIAACGITLCQAGANSNTVAILSDIGYTASYAARISSAYMLMLTVFKIMVGKIFDRIGSLKGSLLIGSCLILFPLAALLIFLPGMPWLYALFLAIAGSGASVLGSVLTSDYFGRKDYAKIYSIIALGPQLGAVFSSPFLGYIFDKTGGYRVAWILIMCMGIVVCLSLYSSNYSLKRSGQKSDFI